MLLLIYRDGDILMTLTENIYVHEEMRKVIVCQWKQLYTTTMNTDSINVHR